MHPIDQILKQNKNSLERKAICRTIRANKKMKAIEKVPFLGVRIDRTTVRRHRYLKAHGLNYSASVARVMLPSDTVAA